MSIIDGGCFLLMWYYLYGIQYGIHYVCSSVPCGIAFYCVERESVSTITY